MTLGFYETARQPNLAKPLMAISGSFVAVAVGALMILHPAGHTELRVPSPVIGAAKPIAASIPAARRTETAGSLAPFDGGSFARSIVGEGDEPGTHADAVMAAARTPSPDGTASLFDGGAFARAIAGARGGDDGNPAQVPVVARRPEPPVGIVLPRPSAPRPGSVAWIGDASRLAASAPPKEAAPRIETIAWINAAPRPSEPARATLAVPSAPRIDTVAWTRQAPRIAPRVLQPRPIPSIFASDTIAAARPHRPQPIVRAASIELAVDRAPRHAKASVGRLPARPAGPSPSEVEQIEQEEADLRRTFAVASVDSAPPAFEAPRTEQERTLLRTAQEELIRLGCLQGPANGAMDGATQLALQHFTKALPDRQKGGRLDVDLARSLMDMGGRPCAPACGHGTKACT